LIYAIERLIGYTPSKPKPPKQSLSLERKLLLENIMLWNQQLHHIGEKGLWALKKKNIVDVLNVFSLEIFFYEHCIYEK